MSLTLDLVTELNFATLGHEHLISGKSAFQQDSKQNLDHVGMLHRCPSTQEINRWLKNYGTQVISVAFRASELSIMAS
jgi:hypothetical protein